MGALYRKYRSATFDEVAGQEPIVTVFKNAIAADQVSHAYLFTGPRGVGKTSVARILAREVNKLAPHDSNFYPDIIEIDAASNRRIEEIRELRDKIAIAPSQLRYKVYIIDEVHMLTREAFNALLKTLEEPPEHAIFILATTEFHKVPETIISRCIRMSFRLVPAEEVIKHLKKIAKQEKITINDEALRIIAEHSGGSFRDAISILDQLSGLRSDINAEVVEQILGLADQKALSQLIDFIKAGDRKSILEQIDRLTEQGATPDQLNKQLSKALRGELSVRNDTSLDPATAISIMEQLNHMYTYEDQKLALELAILKSITSSLPVTGPIIQEVEPSSIKTEKLPSVPIQPSKEPVSVVKAPEYIDAVDLWQAVLEKLKVENNSLYGIARMAEPKITEANQLELAFKFAFHLKQINLQKNKDLILKALSSLKPEIKALNIILLEQSTPAGNIDTKASTNSFESLSNIFGTVEVLDS